MMWKRGEIAHVEQFLLFSTIFSFLLLDFHVKQGPGFHFEKAVIQDQQSRDNESQLYWNPYHTCSKIWTSLLCCLLMSKNCWMANSVDSITRLSALQIWSGSTLFAQACRYLPSGKCPKILYTKVANKMAYMQTVQTQIRLLLQEQSDQGLHCLPFH